MAFAYTTEAPRHPVAENWKLSFDMEKRQMAKDQLSALRIGYAETTGHSLRTAQRHSKSRHPDWLKYIGATAADGVKQKKNEGAMTPAQNQALGEASPFSPLPMPAYYDEPDEDLHPVQRMEKSAWRVHSDTFSMWQEFAGRREDGALAIVYARELPKLRADFDKAQEKRQAWEIQQRNLVTLAEFQQFHTSFIGPISELLKSLPLELASLVNPDNPAFARRQLTHWLRDKAQPQIDSMLQGAEEFTQA